MFIDTAVIKKKIMEQDRKFVADHYGLNENTVKAYQTGQRGIGGMRLETAEKIMAIIHDDMLELAKIESSVVENNKLLFDFEGCRFFQSNDERNIFIKTEKGEKPRKFQFSDTITTIIEMAVAGYYQLVESGSQEDLSDIKEGLALEYFTNDTWEVRFDERD